MSPRASTSRLLNGVFTCLFGFGSAACQSATTGVGTDPPRNANAVETAGTSRAFFEPEAVVAATSSAEPRQTSGSAPQSGSAPGVMPQRESNAQVDVVHVPRRLHELTIESDVFGSIPVLVRVPAHASNDRLPVLFVLHGRGEAVKGPTRGVRAFLDDYGLERVWTWLEREARGPVPDSSVTDSYRNIVAQRLEQQPFRGMIVVMPYLPDRFRAAEAFEQAKPYGKVLRETAGRLRDSFPVSLDVARWGLDGISLGGRVALVCGPALSDVFGAIGGVQAAIDEREFSALVDLMLSRHGQTLQRYSLATSEQDYYRSVLEAFHERLTQSHLPHTFTLLPGDHSYSFNRGPGMVHLLLTYDALLNL